jgi:hypothetical protein
MIFKLHSQESAPVESKGPLDSSLKAFGMIGVFQDSCRLNC